MKPRRIIWEPFALGALLAACWILLEDYPEYWSIPIGIVILSAWNYGELWRYHQECSKSSILKYGCHPFRQWVTAHILCRRKQPLAPIPGCVIAQEGRHRPVQLIAGQSMLYFHYLTPDAEGTAIRLESIVTDFSGIDHRPKFIRKDQRVRYDSIHHAEFFEVPLDMPRSQIKFPVTGILRLYLGKKKRTVQELYILDGTNTVQLRELLHGVERVDCYTEYPYDGISMGEAISRMDRARRLWMLLRTVTILSTAVMMQCGTNAVGKAAALTAIVGEALLLLLFCAKGRQWTIGRRKARQPEQPEVTATLSLSLFAMSLYQLNLYELLDFERFLLFSACAALVMMLVFACTVRAEDWNYMIAMVCLLWGGLAVNTVNYASDPHEPVVMQAQVCGLDTHYSGKGGRSYYVEAALPNGESCKFSVAYRLYDALAVGDAVTVTQYDGLLGIGYAEVTESQ